MNFATYRKTFSYNLSVLLVHSTNNGTEGTSNSHGLPFMPDLGNEAIQVQRLHAPVLDEVFCKVIKVHRLQGEENGSVFFDAHTIAFDQLPRGEVGVDLAIDHEHRGRLCGENIPPFIMKTSFGFC